MSTLPLFDTPPRRPRNAYEKRVSMKDKIVEFFMLNAGMKFSTAYCHANFGTAFRSRVSEANRDPKCPVVIRNEYQFDKDAGKEVSMYWSEVKQ